MISPMCSDFLQRTQKIFQTDFRNFWSTSNIRVGMQQSHLTWGYSQQKLWPSLRMHRGGCQTGNLSQETNVVKLNYSWSEVQWCFHVHVTLLLFSIISCMVRIIKVKGFLIGNRQYLFSQLMLLLSIECQTCTGNTELHQKQQEQDQHILHRLSRNLQSTDKTGQFCFSL